MTTTLLGWWANEPRIAIFHIKWRALASDDYTPFATEVYWRCTGIHLLMMFWCCQMNTINKILRCTYPVNYGGFCGRNATSKRRHPGDPRSYGSVGISQSQCRREGEFRMHHQAPDYGEKKRGFESHPVILFASGRDEVMSSGKTKSFIFSNNKYGRKVQTWVWILFFLLILDPWLLFWSILQVVKVSLLWGLYKGVHF